MTIDNKKRDHVRAEVDSLLMAFETDGARAWNATQASRLNALFSNAGDAAAAIVHKKHEDMRESLIRVAAICVLILEQLED